MPGVIIKCPLCIQEDILDNDSLFTNYKEYAEHILESHQDDEGRVLWASKALNHKPRETIKVRIKKGITATEHKNVR